MQSFHTESMERLAHAMMLLESEEECMAFLEDLCTIMELQDMSQRLDAAIMLKKGCNYQTISKEIGISTATISRVSKCINYGSGGYSALLPRLLSEKNEGEETEKQ
ncbi:MAG: TrpR-related protein YerC/YecD [Parasporobacterium sp.]|nr:TrpR-related protein YerC/YecD [Parasporobacterium sp.]